MKIEVHTFDTIRSISYFNNDIDDYDKYYAKYDAVYANLHYCNSGDFSVSWAASDIFESSKRFIIAYDDNTIYGLIQIAIYPDTTEHISISTIDVHSQHQGKGISKILINQLGKTLSSEFSNKTLSMSGWSVQGWKYLRKSILRMCDEYNIQLNDDRTVEYYQHDKNEQDEFYELRDKIKHELNIIE